MTAQLPLAAVIVPVFRGPDAELRVLLLRRGPHGLHGGQIAFPGGKCEDGDADPLATALREMQEEIAVDPKTVDVLVHLPVTQTVTTGQTVHPFLAKLRSPGNWKLAEQEVEEVFEVPVSYLCHPETRGSALQSFSGWPEPREHPHFRLGSHRIWGLTYRILDPLLPRLAAGEWRI